LIKLKIRELNPKIGVNFLFFHNAIFLLLAQEKWKNNYNFFSIFSETGVIFTEKNLILT